MAILCSREITGFLSLLPDRGGANTFLIDFEGLAISLHALLVFRLGKIVGTKIAKNDRTF